MRQSIIEALQKVYETKCNCDCGQSPCKSCGKDHHDVKEVYKGKNNKFVVYYVKKGNPDSMISSQIFDNESKAKDFENKMKAQGHKIKQHTNEASDDHEISMARGELEAIADKATRLASTLQGKTDDDNLEAWVQSKITKAKDYVNSVADYLTYNPKMNQNEAYGWTLVSKAKDLAKKFANNYTKAVDEIEKLQKGLSKNTSVEKELLKYNENKEDRPSPANPTGKDLEEVTAHVVRYLDPLNKKRFAVPYKTHADAEKKMAQLKRDGVKDIKITMDTLKPGIKFKEEHIIEKTTDDDYDFTYSVFLEKTYDEKDIDKFHTGLDKLVHKHFGHSSDEKKEKEAMKKEETQLDEFTTKQIKALQTAYGMLKGKTISPEKANALSKQLDKMDLNSLKQLVKANIPFVSTVARNKVYKKTGKFESVQKEFSKPRTLGKDGYGTAHPMHPSNKPSMIDKLKHMARISSPIKYGKEEMEEGRKETIKSLYSKGKHSIKDIASRLKLSIDQVKGVLGEAVKKDKPDTSADAASVPVSTPAETKDASRVKQKEDEVERLRDQVAMLKNKLENEKNRAIKPQPNPETGEVPLQVGLAQKLLKDKEKKEVKEGVKQDKDIKDKEGTQPAKYYAKDADGDGMSKATKDKRHAHFKAKKDGPAPGDKDADTKPSVHTKKYKQMYGEENLNEKIEGLEKKAEKSGMPYSILKQVYDRGMAAYKTGHRPGTTPQQWAFARVNSFITKSSGTWGKADKDLADKVRGSKSEQNEACWDTHKQVGTKMKGGKRVPNCVPKNETMRKYVESKLSRLNKEEK